MFHFDKIRRWFATMVVSLILVMATKSGGAVPLFRCSLEDGVPENYHAIIFHDSPFGTEDQELVQTLSSAPLKLGINLLVSTVDVLSEMDEPTKALWSAQTNAELPWLVVLPPQREDAAAVWSAGFGPEAVNAMLDSPARRRVAESLLNGDSAAWVLIECGDAVRDEAAVDVLAGTLKQLEHKLRLPSPATNAVRLRSPLPLRVGYSLVRVTRNDPTEDFFVHLLLRGEQAHQVKPSAFPIFGRGRLLPGMEGRQLQDEAIEKTCMFLMNACTNGARSVGQGRDLLLAANWNSIFEQPAQPVTNVAAAVQTIQAVTNVASSHQNLTRTNAGLEPGSSESAETTSKMGIVGIVLFGFFGGFLLLRYLRQPGS